MYLFTSFGSIVSMFRPHFILEIQFQGAIENNYTVKMKRINPSTISKNAVANGLCKTAVYILFKSFGAWRLNSSYSTWKHRVRKAQSLLHLHLHQSGLLLPLTCALVNFWSVYLCLLLPFKDYCWLWLCPWMWQAPGHAFFIHVTLLKHPASSKNPFYIAKIVNP